MQKRRIRTVAAATSGELIVPVALNKTHVQDLHRDKGSL
jgi:hypothetical protein